MTSAQNQRWPVSRSSRRRVTTRKRAIRASAEMAYILTITLRALEAPTARSWKCATAARSVFTELEVRGRPSISAGRSRLSVSSTVGATSKLETSPLCRVVGEPRSVPGLNPGPATTSGVSRFPSSIIFLVGVGTQTTTVSRDRSSRPTRSPTAASHSRSAVPRARLRAPSE
jgi:hypothetical protein